MDLGYGCPLPSQVPSARPQLPISHGHQLRQSPARFGGIPWPSLRCKPLALLFLLAVAVSPLQAQDPDPAAGLPLCNRTEQVRDAIVSAVGASNCAEVTDANLTEITVLSLAGRDIRTLKTGDFASLTALESLSLNNNSLTGLPSDIFTGLAALQMLNLNNNNLEALTAGVFADLSALGNLYLNDNNLAALPAGVFSSLGALSVLRLEGNPGSGDFLPIVDAGVNQVFDAGRIVTLAAISSDADPWGDNVTFVWAQIENGGDLVTLKDANTARPSFVMPAGTTALEFELIVTGRGGADFATDDRVTVYPSFAAMPVCDRTAQVRDAIVAAVDGVSNCADVTESHLVNISSLILAYRGISALQAGDFSGLLGLRLLSLNNNDLAELPAGIFDVLAGLSVLRLNNNNLAALPAGVFDDLTALQILSLDSNRLTALPAGIFSGLHSLAELRLNGNPGSISFLPIANAGADQTVEAGQIATLTAIASDLDPWRGNVSYVWAQIDNGGDLVTLKDANTARPSFVMPASAAALEFELTAIGRGGDRFAGADRVRVRLPATAVSVCGRTAQVRDAIVEAVSGVNCADITEGHLAGIIQLLLVDKGIGALQAGDFAGLTELEILHLDNNLLTELPPVIFDGLWALSVLHLQGNRLTALPADVFSGLAALESLNLNNNLLAELPPALFDGLGALDTLRLQENLLTTLSAGVFSDLAALRVLFLNQNDLTALPAGVFSSLGALSVLRLEGNPGSGDFLPIADAGADQAAGAGQIVTLTATASDADPWGDNVRFAWAQIDNGGDLVSLKDADTARPSFVMPAGTTALEFELTVTGLGGAGFADIDGVTVFPFAAVLPVCGRTAQVRDAIVGAVRDVSNCADITTAHLANISFLALADSGLSALQAGDFSGLTTLAILLLNGNLLTALPTGVFSNLTELNFLILSNNSLTELPAGAFSDLTELNFLSLNNNNLTALPAGVFTGLAALSALHLNSNRLATLTSGIFDGLAELKVLDLSTNSLTVLPMGLFADLAALESLSLGGNSLTALPAGVFAGLAGLNALYLDDNSFTALSAGAFADLAALESLSLGGNSLTALPAGVFAGLAGLNALYLDDNSFTALSAGAFADLAALESLSLGGNSLTALPAGVFAGLAGLNALYLDDNSFTALSAGAFADLAALESLSLGGNSLTALPAGVFAGLAGLNALYLDDNSFTALSAGAFADLAALESLSLGGNSLTALPAGVFAGLAGLNALYLDDNSLTALPAGAFAGLAALESLGLSGNSLMALPAGVFAGLAGLNALYLDDNSLTALPAGAFAGLAALESLGLSGNSLTALPTGLFSDLTALSTLHLHGNPGSEGFLPIANAGADQSIVAGQIATLAATASDTDPWGGNVRYAWAQIDNGGDLVTLMDADTARPSFVMPEGATALEFELTVAGRGGARYADTDSVTVLNSIPFVPVCDRTEQVRDVIVAAVSGASECAEVTEADLAAITSLNVQSRGIMALKADDFSGFAALEDLYMGGNSLSVLPEEIFAGLAALEELHLSGNGLTALPEGVFGGLTALQSLFLSGNSLTALPAGAFAGLTALQSLYLDSNSLAALPEGVFNGLILLETLYLDDNSLVELPPDAFAGLAALETLNLSGNSLTALSAGAFAGLTTTLRALFLNDNKLAALSAGAFAGLTTLLNLRLDGNSLAELPSDAFTGLTALLNLRLDGNKLAALPAGIFSGTRALADLRLHGNPGSRGFLPIANAGADQSIVAGQIATLAATASDTDPWGDNVRYAWAQIDNGGDLVTLMDADTARPSFVMPEGAIALEFELTITGRGGAGYADTSSVTVLNSIPFVPVCARTEQVRDVIVAAVSSASDCAEVTEAHLAAITSLNVENRGIMALKAGDFSGFAALEDLYMKRNSLSVLPEEIFAGLAALNSLDLGGNGLTALPEGVFSGLTALQLLFLNNNSLTALPPTIFDGLWELGSLSLHDNLLTTLTVGVFSDLAALDTLLLNGNRLVELPPGIFNGLSVLHGLHLYDNSLTALPAGLFSDLRELELLNLSDNSLTELPAGLFSDLRALRILFLQGNPGSEDFLPIANAGAGQVVEAGQIVTLTATASDADPWGDNVRYAWAQIDNGGDRVTLKDANTARPSFVMLAAATVLEFELTVTGRGGARYADTDSVTVLDPSVVVPVCDRTEQVRDAIVAAVDGVSSCADITEADLDGITQLFLAYESIGALQVGDFSGLAALETLDLSGNLLTELPPAIFDGLRALYSLDLSNNSLTELPPAISGLRALSTLRLHNNRLTALPAGAFSSLTDLGFLSLNNNLLTELPPAIFDGLGALNILRLEGNRLTALPAGVFTGLAALSALYLNSNSLAALPSGIFDRLAELEVLYLNNNNLTALPSGIFDRLAELEVLYLNNNNLTALLSGIFTGLSDLKTLKLSDNSLTELPAGLFSDLTELDYLSLSNNLLTELPAGLFSGLRVLTVLRLEGNSLYVLPAGAFVGLARLGVLYLNDNSLTALPPSAFAGLALLDVLYLNGNSLTELSAGAFAGLTALRFLLLDDNDLTALPTDAFTGLTALRTLDLSNNHLMELPEGVFDDLAALDFLSLGANSLTALTAGVFRGLTALRSLDLNTNSLTVLPAGLFSDLRVLRTLFLQNNPGSKNFLPIANAGAGQVVEAGQIATLRAIASDTDPWGDNVRYAWAQIGNGGGVVTLMDADTARPSFVMPAAATALEFELTVTGRGGARYADTDSVTVLDSNAVVSVCDRTEQVRDAIVAAVIGASGCADVTEAQLADIPRLFVTSIGIEALQLGDFSGLAALETLDLSGNILTELPPAIFYGLGALNILRLQGNRLTALPAGVFTGLAALSALYLNRNSLAALPSGIFDRLAELEVLYLNNNNLTALLSGIFTGLSDLETLKLSDNSLTALPAGLFSELTELDYLSLSNNFLTELPAGLFSGLKVLTVLRLEGNSLYVLPAGAFAGLVRLGVLYLNDNSLTALPPSAFAGLAALDILYLNGNSLTELPAGAFAGLTALRFLLLDDNGLTALPADAFTGLTALRTLDLSNNHLMELPEGVFRGLTALRSLDLNDNSLTALTAGVFRGLTALRSLDLNTNSLTVLPAGLFSDLRRLRTLFLQNNPGSKNFLPIANAGAGQVVEAGQIATLRATASDADPWGDNVRYAWAQIGNGGVVTLMDADTARPSFVMPDGATALEFELTATGLGGDRYADTDSVTVLDPRVVVPVCDRTEQVRDAIVAAVDGVSNCANVTEAHLANIPMLLLAGSDISALRAGDFSGLAALETLDLDGNSLSVLPTGVFASLAKLNALHLGGNGLTALPAGVFGGLTMLRSLNLNDNLLAELPPAVFNGLGALYTLRMQENLLTTLPVGVFSDLAALETLLLNDNLLTELPPGIFNGLDALYALHLYNNSLMELPEGVFDDLAALDFLSLRANSLTVLTASVFRGLTALRSLDLNTNSLTELPAGLLAGLVALESLGLSNNSLTALPAGAFAGLTALQSLYLDGNSLTELTADVFRGPTALRSLDLNDNSLTALTAGVFRGLTALRSLDLNTNSLTVLPAGLFSDLRRLRTLFLQNNPGSKNFLPIANAGAGQVVEAGQIATLRATASDADPWGDNVRYAWAQIGNGGVVTLMDADTARPSFVMPDGATALEFELTVTGLGGDRYADTDSVTVLDPRVVVPVCDRTEQVRDAIVAAVDGVSNCANVTEAHLANIPMLLLAGSDISALQAGDFSGLAALETLDLDGNSLSVLPTGVFASLAKLNALHLGGNGLTALPAGVFSDLAALETLLLNDNLLTELPPGIFNGLDALYALHLYNNSLMELPEGVFDDLAALDFLSLRANSLTALTASVFRGLTALRSLDLNTNSLTELPAGLLIGLAALESLGLSNNSLTALPAGAFAGLTALQSLYLDGNSLTALPAGVFSDLRALMMLFLQDNPGSEDFLPIANAGAGQVVEAGQIATLRAIASDADPWGDNIRYAWAQIDNGGGAVTLMGADTASTSFVMPADATAFEFELTVTGRGGARYADIGSVRVLDPSTVVPVCDRTEQVRDAIVAAVDGVSNCANVTKDHLAGITQLFLADESIGALQVGDFSGLAQLGTLDLSGNSLTALSADAFSGIIALEDLDLGSNSLSVLQVGVFDEFFGMEVLNLGGNSLSVLPAGVFADLTALEDLDLGGNSLSVLPAEVFAGFFWLKVLNLGGNGLLVLPAGVFADLIALEVLDLGDNSLSVLPAGVFAGLARLNALHLGGNGLTALPAGVFADLTMLRSLNLNENLLAELPPAVFNGLGALDALRLQENLLTTLPMGVFSDLDALVTLLLNDNLLTALPPGIFNGLSALHALHLYDNSLTALPAGLFSDLRELERLSLNDNLLTALPARLFSDLRALMMLFLQDNPGSEDFLPIANAGADQSIGAGHIVTLTATVSDADPWGDNVRYGWAQIDNSGNAVVLMGGDTARPSFVMPEGATALEFELTVTGRGGARYADNDRVTVRLPAAVVTLSGPAHDLLPADATAIASNELSLVYSYSADDLRGRALTGSIEVAASIDGDAIVPDIHIFETKGEITVVLWRQAYPYPGEHELAVTLSLSTTAEGFALGEPSSITTAFSFLPLPPTVLKVKQAEGNQGKRGAADSDIIELGYVFEYAAGNRLERPRAGLSVQVDIELCADAGGGCSSLSAASMRLTLDDSGSLALRVDRTAAALSVFGEADADSIRHGRVLLRTAGDADFAAIAATTTFSFAVADTVVTLSGPVHDLLPADATAIADDELSLVYSYSADDLRGRTLMGNVDVVASVDGVAITPTVGYVDGVIGEITIILSRAEYPEPDEHELAVTLSLSAAAAGFVLGEPSSIRTPFSFGTPAVADTVVTLSGPVHDLLPADATAIAGDELSLVYSYSADDLRGRTLMGNVDVVASVDGVAITPTVGYVDGVIGEITIILSRAEYPEPDEHELAVTLSLSATATGFALGKPSSIRTPFSFGTPAVADTVVTLSGPVHDLLPADATAIAGDELSLVYSYSADDLRGRTLMGNVDVVASVDGVAITPTVGYVDGVIGEITIILSRAEYPEPDEHELAVTLSLSATATGFALGEPSSIRTPFSFGTPAVADTVVTLSGPVHDLLPADATAIAGDELSLVYSYSADDLRGRTLMGNVDVVASVDGVAITPTVGYVDGVIGEITIILSRAEYPEPDEHELAVTLSLSATATGFALGKPSSIRTPFSFGTPAVADTVVTLSGPVHDLLPADATAIAGDELSLVYSYSADDLRGRTLMGNVDVVASVDGVAITPTVGYVDGVIGEITIILSRAEYPEPDEHELAVTLSLSATATGFALGKPSSIRTPFSFGTPAVADTVVTLSGPVHDLLPADATAIAGDELSLVYSYSADDLRGRTLMGNVDVVASVDGVAITPTVGYVDGVIGEITIILSRAEYPEPDEHELAVTLSLSATATGFALGKPSSIRTPFSFGTPAVADTVVTLSGPVHELLPADATAIAGDELSLVYSYSADDLRGRTLMGNVDVVASVDGVAITPTVGYVDGVIGEITIILSRAEYPEPDEHELAVTLSLSATATGFALGEPSSIRTPFSFGTPAVADTVVTLSGPVHDLLPADATAIAGDELSLVYSYSADDLRGRTLMGNVDVVASVDGVAITPTVGYVDGVIGEITIILSRAEYPEPDEHELAVTLSLSATATGFALGEPSSIRTPFSFGTPAVADTVVTLSGPVHDLLPADATAIAGDELSLVYSYSADDLRGRTLMGNVDVVASVDGVAITPTVGYVDGVIGEITIILSRAEYPEPDEHELAVTLSLSATATGFALGEPSSIRTPFSFGTPAVADTVVTLSGPVHDLLPADATAIAGDELSLVYSYSADDLRGRTLMGNVDVVASVDGVAITPTVGYVDGVIGEITIILSRAEYPEPDEHELAVTLSLSAAATGFALGEPSSIRTPFSFGTPAVADTVVTLSGPVHDLLPADATAIAGDELSLVYSYSADDLRGRTLMGNVDVVASVDGVAITPTVGYVDGVIGEITIILSRAEYPEPDEHELAVTLSLSATATGFALGKPSSIRTPFSFGTPAVADTVVTLSGPVHDLLPADATAIAGDELSLVYSYSADDLRGRTLMGNVDVVASVDGVAITPTVGYVDGVIGEITIILSRAEYPEPDEHELAVTLSLSATATGFALGEPSSIRTPFSFGTPAVADTVVTLSGPVHDLLPADATAIAGDELSLVYSYSADDLRGRTLMGNVDVVASVDGVAITPTVGYVDGVIGEITIILSRAEYPEPDEHELAVTLSLSATATGFALGKPSSIRTPFSFGTPAVADTVVTHTPFSPDPGMTCCRRTRPP